MISFIIQGPYFKRKGQTTTHFALKLRALNPDCEIIFSTWEGEEVENENAFDKIIYNVDPGSSGININGKGINADRQLVSTLNGLKEATKPYCIKLRSDCLILKPEILDSLKKHCDRYSMRHDDNEIAIFKNKVAVSNVTTKYPKLSTDPCFHLSDWFYFGLKEDLIDLLDILPYKQAGYDNNPTSRTTVAPEQHIIISWLKKHKLWQPVFENSVEKHQEVLHNNFVIISYNQLGLKCYKFGYHLPIGTNGFLSYTKFDFAKEYSAYFKIGHQTQLSGIEELQNSSIKGYHWLRFRLIRMAIWLRRSLKKR
ncbi:WavE lipopolysaccharide synthesis family protein [Roseivirga pacifica]